jgi:hypothetical protein
MTSQDFYIKAIFVSAFQVSFHLKKQEAETYSEKEN